MTILDALEQVLVSAINDNDEYPSPEATDAIGIVDEWLSEYRKLGPTREEWAGVPDEYRWFAIDGYIGTPKQTAGFTVGKPYFDYDDSNCWLLGGEDTEMDFLEVEPREVPYGVHEDMLLWERPAS